MNPRNENMPPIVSNAEVAVPKADSASDSSEGEKKTAKPAPETETTAAASSKKRPATTVESATDDEPEVEPSKRSRHEEEAAEEDEVTEGEGELLDLATTLGLKPGERFEVQWEITQGDESGGDAAAADADVENEEETVETRWWGATLLEHDGRTEDSVAVRVLDYDPYPEGGFPERSREDVIFLGRDVLIDPNTHEEMRYRPLGEDDSTAVWLGREGVEEVVNATLANAMQKNSKSWNGLSRAQQASIADIIAKKKEKLLELLLSQPNGVVTTTEMHAIIAKTMQE